MIEIGVFGAMIAMLSWAFANVIAKRVSTVLGTLNTSLVIIPLGILPMVIYLLLNGGWAGTTAIGAIIAAISGIFLFLGFFTGYKALETEQLTNAYVLGEMQPALLVLFGLSVLGQRLTQAEAAGVAVIFLGAFLVITNERFRINKMLIPSLFSSLLFTAYWILMNYAIGHSTNAIAPLTIGRIVGVVTVLGYLFMHTKEAKNSPRKRIRLRDAAMLIVIIAITAGILDGSGDVAFAVAIQANFLTIGSALTALAPVVAAVASYFVYKERLSRLQFIGFMIMVLGAVSLSLF
ncbi:MAG: EamA family transporter [Candidatus Micrarchaeota archaeon]|nr:EamA family transporter [Candidatus Micrarchaeota archaeon]